MTRPACIHPRPHNSGVALPICLMLAALISLVSLSALRGSTLEASVATSVAERQQRFAAAENQLSAALTWARTHMAALPGEGATITTTVQPGGTASSATVAVSALGSDALCPDFNGRRMHYELRTSAADSRGARREHIRGFFVCRETCATACVPRVAGPALTYWYFLD